MEVHSSCRLLVSNILSNNLRTTTHARLLHSHHAKNQPRQTTDSRHLSLSFMDLSDHPYSNWSPERLIRRVVCLEKELREQNIKYLYHFTTLIHPFASAFGAISNPNKGTEITVTLAKETKKELSRRPRVRPYQLLYTADCSQNCLSWRTIQRL